VNADAQRGEPMIFPGSRYQNSPTYTNTRPDGTVVAVLNVPLPGPAVVQGYYQRRGAGQRLDLIANYFLNDATTLWKLCDANNAVVPDALAARDLIGIPPTGQ
jgi:hypothetical protein